MSNNVFIFKKFKSIRKYEKKIKMKRINFETLIDSFYRFSSKKPINENVNNSKSKYSFSNFNDDLTKTLKKSFETFIIISINYRLSMIKATRY